MKKYLPILLMAAMAASFPMAASADSRIERLERQVGRIAANVCASSSSKPGATHYY